MSAGGAEKLVSSLATEQAKKNSIGVFTFVNKVDVFSDKMNEKVVTYKAKSQKYLSISSFIKLFKTIKKYDIIHVHLFPAFYISGLLSLFFWNKKWVYTEHSTFNRRRSKIFYLLEKFMYSRYQTIICISKSVEDKLRQWMGKGLKTKVIKNFVDLQEIQQQKPIQRDEIQTLESDKLLVMVGSFRNDGSKDHETVLKALQILPENFKLIFVGGGFLVEKVKATAAALNLTNRVQFLGFRTDVYSILKSCDYGILSSNWEGFGIVVLEYMACGLPAIGTNVEGLKDLLQDPNTRFEVGDFQELAQKINYFENHAQQIKQRIEQQNEFIKNFSLSQAAIQHQNVYLD